MVKEQDAFAAGWDACYEYYHHEWGPSPANNPTDAKKVWENTCDNGHVIRVPKCVACDLMSRITSK